MLFLVGIGLETGDISLRTTEIVSKADKLLLDRYTNFISDEELKSLSASLRKAPRVLERSDLEENASATVEDAKEKNVVILVPGDPLIATTHHIILDAAKRLGIPYKIIHNTSIFSAAIGESGLDLYKFGPTTTIPFWTDKYKPISFMDVIAQNVSNKQHTLVLLDYNYKENRRMGLSKAVRFLHKADESVGCNLIKRETRLIILGDVGKETQKISYVSVGEIDKGFLKQFLNKTLCIIFPAKLNFAEEEALSKFNT